MAVWLGNQAPGNRGRFGVVRTHQDFGKRVAYERQIGCVPASALQPNTPSEKAGSERGGGRFVFTPALMAVPVFWLTGR